MGNIYKRGKTWYLDIRVKGRRIRKRVGSSKKIAELALRDAEVKIARDEFGFSKNDIDIDDFLCRFRDYSLANHRSTSTSRYQAVIDHFRAFLSENSPVTFLSEINTELIDLYKVHRKRSGVRSHTINFELDTLRLIFNLAIKWGYIKNNPTKGITRLKVDDAKPVRFLSQNECDRLLGACPENLYPIYYTFLTTGMRKGELENLQWGDVDLRRKQIQIRSKEDWNPKSGERSLPMTAGLAKLLGKTKKAARKPTENNYVFPVKTSGHSRNRLRTDLIRIAKNAGIKDLTKLHTLRHTFASHLVMKGVDLPTVKKLMGHSDIQTTMIYAHLAPDHLADAVTKLPFGKA